MKQIALLLSEVFLPGMKSIFANANRTLITVITIALVGTCAAPSHASEAQAIANARSVASYIESIYNVCFRKSFSYGVLNQGGYYDLNVTFERGVTYYLIAGGCDYCQDIDLSVYDGYWNLVMSDNDASKAAVVKFTPTVGGTFHIRVKMYRAFMDNVHWSLLYGFICDK